MEKLYTQGSDEWKEWRLNKLGASESSTIMGTGYQHNHQKLIELWKVKSGILPYEFFMNPAMERGMKLESTAREHHEKVTGISTTAKCHEYDAFPYMSAS